MDAKIGDFHLKDCAIDKLVERHYSRVIEDGVEGDDLADLGRKSAEFTIKGKLEFEQFLELEKELGKGQPMFESRFGRYMVVARRLLYKSTGDFEMTLLEDIR